MPTMAGIIKKIICVCIAFTLLYNLIPNENSKVLIDLSELHRLHSVEKKYSELAFVFKSCTQRSFFRVTRFKKTEVEKQQITFVQD